MRIAVLCSDPRVPLGGMRGPSVRLRGLARAWQRSGHSVHAIVAARGDDADVRALEADGVEIRDLRVNAPAREVDWHFARCEAELVFERLAPGITQGAIAAKGSGLAHLYDVVATPECDGASNEGAELARSVREGLEASCGAVAVNDQLASWVRTLAPGRFPVRVVEHGAGPDFFESPDPDTVARVRARLGVPARGFVVGFLGSLHAGLELEPWVEAVSLLPAALRTRLLVMGDGPRRNDLLAAAVRAGVPSVFAGWVRHDEVPAHLALCDAVVIPCTTAAGCLSRQALTETMAAGRPIVANRDGENERLLFHEHSGLLVDGANRDAIAGALEQLACDRPFATRLGTAARRTAKQRFTWDHAAETVAEFGLSALHAPEASS